MKLSSLNQTGRNRGRRGFTLIELMIVIIIIGILVGLLLPAIGAALRRSREFTIEKDIQDLRGAIESFKTKYGVYPIDFKNGNVITAFVDRLSDRHAYNRLFANGAPYVLDPANALPNPHGGAPATRSTATIDAAECYVFFMYELTTNKEYPLGYVWDGSNYVIDPNAQRDSAFNFREAQLTDLDGDGWLEYVPDPNKPVPYCYFDARSYSSDDPTIINLCLYPGNAEVGTCVPYSHRNDVLSSSTYPYLGFAEPTGYQLISAGLDGVYGSYWGNGNGETVLEVRRCTDFTQIKYDGTNWIPEDDINRLHNPAGLNASHNDNFVQYFEGRIDKFKQ